MSGWSAGYRGARSAGTASGPDARGRACCVREPFRVWLARKKLRCRTCFVEGCPKMLTVEGPWMLQRSSRRDGWVPVTSVRSPRKMHQSEFPGNRLKMIVSESSTHCGLTRPRSVSKPPTGKVASCWRYLVRYRKACWSSKAKPRA